MAQSWLGTALLYAHRADRRGCVGDRLHSHDCRALRSVAAMAAPRRRRSSRTGRIWTVAALASAAVLRLLRRLRVGADLHSATLAALLLQRALRDGDAAGACNLRRSRSGASRSVASRTDRRLGSNRRAPVAADRDVALRR